MIKIIILSILLVITLILIKKNIKNQGKPPSKSAKKKADKIAKEKGCKYNEMNLCWGMCCNMCQAKESCNFACFDNHESCKGYK